MKSKLKKLYFTNDFSAVNVQKLQGEGWVLRNARLAANDSSVEPADEYGGDVPLHYKRASGSSAMVNLAVGISPELQALIDDAHAECKKATEENSQLRKKVSILEQAAGNQSDLTSENSRLKDALTNAEKSVQTINEQFTLLKAEYEAFQNDVGAMSARIGELTAGSATESQNDVPKLVDYESWDEDQIKELLTSKDIGYKPTATKAQLLKLIPKE
ncbi:hypothetical protein ACMXYY_14010 [Acinetobacter courvalinii]